MNESVPSAIVSLMREQKDAALMISALLQQVSDLEKKVERLSHRVMVLECIGEERESWSA